MKKLRWLPTFDSKIWILAAGRLLSQVGTGFTFFYLPIFFVNEVGLSAAAVGAALGSASLSGMLGRFWGGTMIDAPAWGRRKTLLIAMVVSSIGAFVLAFAENLSTLVLGNLLMGMGVGLYWPATEAVVADLSPLSQRSEAYGVTRLADSLGLGIGVVLGGILISMAQTYRGLLIADGLSFLLFLGILYLFIPETTPPDLEPHPGFQGWGIALRDRRFLIYIAVNLLITTYLSQLNSTLPLYLKNFAGQGSGFPELGISLLFAWHLGLAILLQLPIARRLGSYSYAHALILSTLIWGIGFILTWLCGVMPMGWLWAILALGCFAIAMASYTPIASALVVALAPESLRGVYLSLNSQCWAIGYLVGPALGGAAMDPALGIAPYYWLALAGSVPLGIGILQRLEREMNRPTFKKPPDIEGF